MINESCLSASCSELLTNAEGDTDMSKRYTSDNITEITDAEILSVLPGVDIAEFRAALISTEPIVVDLNELFQSMVARGHTIDRVTEAFAAIAPNFVPQTPALAR